tara:strand:+ start:384 stop:1067 length:684 start_codon:yes stop_codon:yes gene_type:complete
MSNTNERTDDDRFFLQVLEANYQYDLIFRNVIEQGLMKAPMIKIKPTSKMGFVAYRDGEQICFQQPKGVYGIGLNCRGYLAPIYNGQSNSDNGGINYRVRRCIKAALGLQRQDEKHSGGQYLYDKFGPNVYWPDNLYVRFVSLDMIKDFCKDIIFKKYSSPLAEYFGEDGEFINIDDMTDAAILDFFEKLSFDIMQPVANKNNTNQGRYNKIFETHLMRINEVLCMS